MDLFTFDDDFLAAAACGLDDVDTLGLMREAVRAGADVVEQHVRRTERDVDVVFRRGAFEIDLDQEQFEMEYGDGATPARPQLRQALIASAQPASRAISEVLSAY